MGKKKEKKPDLEEALIKAYQNWENTRETGCRDPFYDDSVNLNLLRNHMQQILQKEYRGQEI